MSEKNTPVDSISDDVPREQIDAFCSIVKVPAFMIPWLSRFFEPREIAFVLGLNRQHAKNLGGQGFSEWIQKNEPNWPDDFLARCYRRGVISLGDDGNYVPADFHTRYEFWALFEGWQDLPGKIKDRLNRWELKSFVDRKKPHIDAFKKSGQRDKHLIWPEYVLLDEALALIQKAPHVYLWPCNCRAMMQRCKKPGFVCLRFSNNRNLGWEVSKERARDILLEAHKKGLMQSAEVGLADDGSLDGAICNCCSDCCYPVQLADYLNETKLYPLSRYVAHWHADKCSNCGRCVGRCPFKAFTLSKKISESGEHAEKKIHYRAELCRGCGLCSTSCPDEAIEMQPLDPTPLSMVGGH